MLNHKIGIIIPSNIQGIVSLTEQATWKDMAMRTLSGLFGGATVIDGEGGYVTQSGVLVVESVKIVYSFTDGEGLRQHKSSVIAFAEVVRSKMQQESVAIEIDGTLTLIEGKKAA